MRLENSADCEFWTSSPLPRVPLSRSPQSLQGGRGLVVVLIGQLLPQRSVKGAATAVLWGSSEDARSTRSDTLTAV